MKKAFLLFLTVIFFQNVFAQNPPARSAQSFDLSQYGVRIEPDSRLIVVMANARRGGNGHYGKLDWK